MLITLIAKDRIKQMILPKQKIGKYLLLTDQDTEVESLTIEGDGGYWCLKHHATLRFINQDRHLKPNIRLDKLRLFEMIDGQQQICHLLVEPLAIDRRRFNKYQVKIDSPIQIGRGKANQINIDYPFISKKHARLCLTKSGWIFEDCASLNGSFLNGRRVAAGVQYSLKLGDIIFIMGFKLIIGCDFISFNSADSSVSLQSEYIFDYEMTNEPNSYQNISMQTTPSYFYPKSEFYQPIHQLELVIEPPTSMPLIEEQPLLFIVGPALTMVITSMSTGMVAISQSIYNGNFRSAVPMLIMAFSMLIGSLLWPLLAQRHRQRLLKKQNSLREKKYRQYLTQAEAKIEQAGKWQTATLQGNYQSFGQLWQQFLECPDQIWRKQMTQVDFLKVRVGSGNLPLALSLQYPKRVFSLDEDLLLEAMYQFVEADYQLASVPITISLTDYFLTGVIGEQKYQKELAINLIFQLALEYRYDELKMIFIYQASAYHFVRWLPHVWSESANFRFVATDEISLIQLSHQLEQIILQITAEKSSQTGRLQLPHYLIFILSNRLTLSDNLIRQLMTEPVAHYFSVIHFTKHQSKLIRHCNQLLAINATQCEVKTMTKTCQVVQSFKPDCLPVNYDCRQLAISLFNRNLKMSQELQTIPKSLTFLQLFKVTIVEHLNVLERWGRCALNHSLETPIGINAQGELLMLDLHDKADGPHGLIAGMTGSGKSELIITYLLSLAVNYHPNQIAFLLIDYKGGGLAKAFQDLPHTSGIITNLDGTMIYRAMIAIESELRRRQEIFNQVSQKMGISNLDIDYYQILFRNQRVSEPLPHLLIISDEFAELKAQHPEFMVNLISTARIGRSLGLHLILATQKPSGVVDEQIWSNSRFRIALKVQERADSMEMLRRTEAAEIKVSGRFYLQVGYNEKFILAQSAWSGADYLKSAANHGQVSKKITAINQNGQSIGEWSLDHQGNQVNVERIKQIDAVKAHIQWLAKTESICQRPLWLAELKPILIYDDIKQLLIKEKLNQNLEILIGVYDHLKAQNQPPLTMTLDTSGHIAILGSIGSGKAMLIQTIIYDLISYNSPLNLQIYIFDFAEEILPDFKSAPQVCDFVYMDEMAKITKILKQLLNELRMRRQKIVKSGVDFQQFQQIISEPLPNIILIIHHFAQFYEQSYLTDNDFLSLLREGAKYGIHLIISGLCLMDIRYSWQQYFPQFIVLQMNEISEYPVILGKTDGLMPAQYLGRGLIKLDEIYEFQTVRIARTTSQVTEQIKTMINAQKIKWPQYEAEH